MPFQHAAPGLSALETGEGGGGASSNPDDLIPPRLREALRTRLAARATAEMLAVWAGPMGLSDDEFEALVTFLHITRGNAMAERFTAALAMARQAPDSGVLAGRMLVSNNPEAIYAPGVLATARDLAPGPLDLYVHHGNHTGTGLAFYLHVRTKGGDGEVGLQSVSAVGTTPTVARGVRAEGASGNPMLADPNQAVAGAVEDRDDGDSKSSQGAKTISRTGKGADIMLPLNAAALPSGKGDNAPMIDSRGFVDLAAVAGSELRYDVDVVAAPAGNPAASSKTPAIGNTAYQSMGNNGRASGLYQGAHFGDERTIDLASLGAGPMRYAIDHGVRDDARWDTTPRAVAPTTAALPDNKTLESKIGEVAKARGLDLGDAKGAALELVVADVARWIIRNGYRIATSWLEEKGEVNGVDDWFVPTIATTIANQLPGALRPVATLIGGVLEQVRAYIIDTKRAGALDDLRAGLDRLDGAIDGGVTIGADGDYGSYGTIFDLGFVLRNDDDQAHTAALAIHVGAGAYRGVVSVDGVDRRVTERVADGDKNGATLPLSTHPVAPGEEKYVRVQLMSPGQITAGQALVFSRSG